MPDTLDQTAEAATPFGGRGIALHCDHHNAEEVVALFALICAEAGRLDIGVNNVWGGYEHYTDGTEFWKEKGFWTMSLSRWDAMFQAGVRAHYIASDDAAPLMIVQRLMPMPCLLQPLER